MEKMSKQAPKNTIDFDLPSAKRFLANSPLNDSQKDFCLETEKKVRLLAPAGNGKTHSLLWRCLTQLLYSDQNTSSRFLIFTFTRAARDELVFRVNNESHFAPLRNNVEIFTLNAWGNRRLKSRMRYPKLLTANQDLKNCMLYDLKPIWMNYEHVEYAMTEGRRKYYAAKDLMDLMDDLKGMGFRHDLHAKKADFFAHIDWLNENGMKSNLFKVHDALSQLEIIDDQFKEEKTYKQIYDNYFMFWCESTQWLYDSSRITMEDQKYWTLIDIENSINKGQYTSGIHRFQHVLVDEFQDINILDLLLLKAIAAANKTSLCIIGDDDQAIFEWRGATPGFLLTPDEFIEDNYSTHVLDTNYRSPKNIVELSQKLIKHNKNRVNKKIKAHLKEEAEITIEFNETIEDSIEFVTDYVKELLEDSSVNKIALISRKRSQIIPYQIVFASEDIPFCAAEDLQIFLSKAFNELREFIGFKLQCEAPAYFGPDPVESILKFCSKVKRYGLKKDDYGKLKAYLSSKRPKNLLDALNYLYSYDGPLKGDNKDGKMSASFYDAISKFIRVKTVAETIRIAGESFEGLQKDYSKSLDDIFYLDPPFSYLSEFAERYNDDYIPFLEDLDKAMSTLAHTPNDENEDVDNVWQRRLHLMTALRAKGKEFDAVIILDCNQDIFPSKFAENEEQLEAERRLFYVAFTRAKKNVLFSINENMFGKAVNPSQFLSEMDLL